MTDTFGDAIVTLRDDVVPDPFFDRFVFNVHPWDRATPTLHIGFGAHPVRGVADGFVLAVTEGEQRNHRYSTALSEVRASASGRGASVEAFRWETVEPMAEWRIGLDENDSGVAFDLTWRRRTPPWSGRVQVGSGETSTATFDHLFQSGTYEGWIEVDGERTDVSGWVGARDRSRGVRTMRGGQGLHLWVLAHLPSRTVGAMLVEDREGGRILVEGGVLGVDGTVDTVTEVLHDLTFDELLDLDAAALTVRTESGGTYELLADTSARGGYMAGGGYGDHHGEDHGSGHREHDVYPLDGTVGPMTLDSALTDRSALFTLRGDDGLDESGAGIFEFARTRSPRYTYRPTRHRA
jgi:hypothetical protein